MFVVNGKIWYLMIVPITNKHFLRSDGSSTIGATDNKDKTVYIASGLSDEMFDKVLVHELVHVFSFSYGLFIPIETEEIIADFMANYGREVIYLADKLFNEFLRNVA